MTLMRLTLTFSERHLINSILNDLEELDIQGARTVRELSRVLGLREVKAVVEELIQTYSKVPNRGMRWADILDLDENDHSEKGEERIGGPRMYTLDDSYIRWLQDIFNAKDWNRQVVIAPNGDKKEVDMPVSVEQAITIANLDDSLRDAKPVSGGGDNTPKDKQE